MDLDFSLEELDFILDPIFVIGSRVNDNTWFLERIEFSTASGDIVRKLYWTRSSMQALHFHDWDDVHAFADSQFGTRVVSVREL